MQYLAAIAEQGQMTAAARRLNVAQSALSQAIRQLEAELGTRLLERRPRGVKLTAAGAEFLLKARVAVAAEADAVQTAEFLARSARGELNVGFVGPPPPIVGPEPFAAFSASHPRAQLSFRDLPFPHGATSTWLAEVDLAICHLPELDEGLVATPLRVEARAVVMPRSHPLVGRDALFVADLLDETFVSYHPSVQRAWAGFHSLDDHRGTAPERTTADHALTSLQMLGIISRSQALTTVPHCDAKVLEQILPDVAVIPIADAQPAEVSMIWSRGNQNPLLGSLVSAVTRDGVADGL